MVAIETKYGGEMDAVRIGVRETAHLASRHRHSIDVPSHRYQRPLPMHRLKTLQQELPEARLSEHSSGALGFIARQLPHFRDIAPELAGRLEADDGAPGECVTAYMAPLRGQVRTAPACRLASSRLVPLRAWRLGSARETRFRYESIQPHGLRFRWWFPAGRTSKAAGS